MAGQVQFGGSAGLAPIQSLGGRHMVRGTNGVTWILVNEITGISNYLVAYYFGIDSVTAQREVVSGPSIPSFLAIAACIDISDQPVVVCSKASSAVIVTFRREAGTWTAKATISSQTDSVLGLQVMARKSGTFDLVFGDYRPGSTDAVLKHSISTDDLATWPAASVPFSSTSVLGIDVVAARRVAAVMDRSSNIHAVMVFRTATRWAVQYAKYTGSWGSLEAVSDPEINQATLQPQHLSIAVDQNDAPHVAWSMQVATTYPGTYAIWYGTRAAGSWSMQEQIHAAAPSSQTLPAIQVNSAGLVTIFWEGDGISRTKGYDELYRAYGSVGSWTIGNVTDGTAGLVQADCCFSVSPYKHGYFETGFLAFGSVNGIVLAFDYDTIQWNLEPRVATTLMGATLASKAGSNSNLGNALRLDTKASLQREVNVVAITAIALATRFSIPFGSNRIAFAQAVSLAGSVWRRSASTALAFETSAQRILPALCETDYVPSPAISASDASFTGVFLFGPFPSQATSLKMPLPDYGNGRVANTRVKLLETMSGETYQIQATSKRRSFPLRWSQLSRKKALEADAFLDAMTGSEIVYRDENGVRWRCHVISGTASFTRNSKDFGASFDLELEGTVLT